MNEPEWLRVNPNPDLVVNTSPPQTFVIGHTFTCRWCGHENKAAKEMRCVECKAQNGITMWIHDNGPAGGIKLYHNPDNSLFIDFVKPDGKTARYTLSAAYLLERGLLRLFETDPQGRRNP